jgi:hypothetical protein
MWPNSRNHEQGVPPTVVAVESSKISPDSKDTEMKLALGILTVLILTAVLLAVPLVARRAPPQSDCVGQVVIVTSPAGRPIECVCIGGVLSTCFDPGP